MEPASTEYGLETRRDERLREARRPTTWMEDYEGAVRLYLEHPEEAPAGWESAPEVRSRMAGCIAGITARHPGETVAVCGRGLSFSLYLSGPPSPRASAFDLWRSMGFARVAVVEDGLASPFGAPAQTHG